jgi:hypothetical protein
VSLQVSQSEGRDIQRMTCFIATTDKLIRSLTCHVQAAGLTSTSPGFESARKCKILSSTQFFQGIKSPATALCCARGILLVGSADGSVGLISLQAAVAKAHLVNFHMRHSQQVEACYFRFGDDGRRGGSRQLKCDAIGMRAGQIGRLLHQIRKLSSLL